MSKEATARSAMKLALEALVAMSPSGPTSSLIWHQQMYAITALREALASEAIEQPAQQQEPVVWMYVNKSTHETKFQKHMRDFVDHGLWAEVPLYGEPLANQELNCVCGAVWQGDELVHLPRKPAQRTWVGLTDEERKLVRNSVGYNQWMTAGEYSELVQKATEAKLKQKNTP